MVVLQYLQIHVTDDFNGLNVVISTLKTKNALDSKDENKRFGSAVERRSGPIDEQTFKTAWSECYRLEAFESAWEYPVGRKIGATYVV